MLNIDQISIFSSVFVFFTGKTKNADTASGRICNPHHFCQKNTSGMFLFSQSQTIFPEWSVLSGLVPRTAQCNPPSHRPFSRLRGATEPHTACSHGKTCRKKSLHYRYNFAAEKVAKSAKKFFIFLLL